MIQPDANILSFLNKFADHWPWFDYLVTRANNTNLLQTGVLVLLAWYALFDRNEKDRLRKDYELLLGAALLSSVAVVTARALALTLPFRARPIWVPDLHFHVPRALAGQPAPFDWSSLPSDHAVLYSTLVTGIFFVAPHLGWLAAVWAALVGCFPLLYLGIHWPSDLLAGAILGTGIAQAARIPVFRTAVRRAASYCYRERPGLFFAVLFFGSYQIVTLFDDGRRLASRLYRLVRVGAPLHVTALYGLAAAALMLLLVLAAVWGARRLGAPRRLRVSSARNP